LGWAWLAAAVAAWLLVQRKQDHSWVAAVLLGLLAVQCTSAEPRLARMTLEGFSLPVSESTLVHLGPQGDRTAPAVPLDGVSDPVGVRLDAGRLTLDVPPEATSLVGFATPDSPFPFHGVHPLVGGERLVLCPHDGPGCSRRELAVSVADGHVSVGPCDLSGETRSRLSREPAIRAVALLDLYHYAPDRCTPQAVGPDTPFWAHQDGAGGTTLPLESFLLLRGDQAWLVVQDPQTLLSVEGLAPSAAVLTAQAAGAATVETLVPRQEVLFDALILEALPGGVPVCEDGYGPTGRDLSGEPLCKRIRVRYSRERLHLDPGSRLVITPEEPPTISVSPACPDRGRCGPEHLAAAYLSDAELPLGPETPVLGYPLTLRGGEPLAAELRFSDDDATCRGQGSPCVVVRTRGGATVYPAGQVIALGDPVGEQHLLRVVPLDRAGWLVALVGGLLLLQALVAPVRQRPLSTALVTLAGALLMARALFGFKVMARFPHDAEGLLTGLLGAALVPLLLRAAGLGREGWRTALGLLGAGVVGGGLLVWLGQLGTLPLDSPEIADAGVVLGLLAVAVGLSIAFGDRAWAHVRARNAVANWVPLVALAALAMFRSGLALVGWERLFGVPVILWYWPAAIGLSALVLQRWMSVEPEDLQALGGPRAGLARLLTLPGGRWVGAALVVGAVLVPQVLPGGDKGAAMVLAPALLVGLAASWGRGDLAQPARRQRNLRLLVLGTVAVALSGSWLAERALDGRYAPVAARSAGWEEVPADAGGHGQVCPPGPQAESGAFELAPYASALERDNVEIRIHDYLLPGAANRAGSRTGAQVHESLAVMRRYAAGPEGRWMGDGFGTVDVRPYGRAEVDAQLFDGVPSVLLSSEGGTAAVVGLLLLHLLALVVVVKVHEDLQDQGASPTLAYGAVACVTVPAWTTLLMLGGNYGLMPFTGQSTPLLAVISGTDLVLAPTLWCLALVLTRLARAEVAPAQPPEPA